MPPGEIDRLTEAGVKAISAIATLRQASMPEPAATRLSPPLATGHSHLPLAKFAQKNVTTQDNSVAESRVAGLIYAISQGGWSILGS